MALNLRKGADAIRAAAERSGGTGKFVPSFKFEPNKSKYIQFLTPIEEVPTVLFHNFIITGFREDGGKQYASFISRKDPQIDGPDGYDPLIDRFSSMPSSKNIALAVELEPEFKQVGTRKVPKSFSVQTRQFEGQDGEIKEVPAVGLVIQSPGNFFNHLTVISDTTPIEETILAVTRTGKSTDTDYTFVPVPGIEPLDLSGVLDEIEFDFDAYLEELASEDRIKELIGSLPDDFVVNPYAKKDKKKSSGTSSRTASKSEESLDETEEPQEKPSRSRRFAALAAEVAATEED